MQRRDMTVLCRLSVLAVVWLIGSGCAGPGLARYKNLIVADAPECPVSGVRVTYLGVNGYLLQSRDAAVLVDPYFSRVSAGEYLFSSNLRPNEDRIRWAERFLPSHVDLILVTHAHCDHLFDVPAIARRTGALVVASRTSCYLARSMGTPANRLVPMLLRPGAKVESRSFGAVTVQTILTDHDRLFGMDLFPGTLESVPASPPTRGARWVAGEPLSFVITMGGKRIFINSGSIHPPVVPVAPVDLAILGAAAADSRKDFVPTVRAVSPRYIIASHQDNFFMAPEKGFHFLPSSNFPAVIRDLQKEKPPGYRNLVVLDYFRPWTLR
jgi:L-ascorbate metabolism protein UlaG (beta-lactamase superfamily)